MREQLTARPFARRAVRTASRGVAIATLAGLLAACGGDDDTGAQSEEEESAAAEEPAEQQASDPEASTTTVPDAAVTVTMALGKYEPESVEVRAGETVAWNNNDTEVHGPLKVYADGDVTKQVGATQGVLHQGRTWTYTFEEPGRYLLVDFGATLDVRVEQWIDVT
jgi:plastocyanin